MGANAFVNIQGKFLGHIPFGTLMIFPVDFQVYIYCYSWFVSFISWCETGNVIRSAEIDDL